jgi:hypothetical protein
MDSLIHPKLVPQFQERRLHMCPSPRSTVPPTAITSALTGDVLFELKVFAYPRATGIIDERLKNPKLQNDPKYRNHIFLELSIHCAFRS